MSKHLATYGALWRTSGAVAGTAGGKIKLPPGPASSLQTVDFSTAVFTGSPSEWQQRNRLLWALFGSLALHWAGAALLPRSPGVAASEAGPAAAALRATLRGGGQPALLASGVGVSLPTLPAIDGLSEAGRASELKSESLPPAHWSESPESPASERALVTLGQRRLAAYLPPYLEQASSFNPPPRPWYFSRSELTLPPVLLDDPLVQSPERGSAADSAAPRTGTVLLRVYVGAGGAVEHIEVASSSLPPAFDEAAVAAFSRLRFRPGEIAGVAVGSDTRFEVLFDGSDPRSSHSTDGVGIREMRSRGGVAPAVAPRAVEAGGGGPASSDGR